MTNKKMTTSANPLVKTLIGAREACVAVAGYIGPPEGDAIRIYRDLTLSKSIKIHTDAFVHSEISEEPRVASHFYIRESAPIEFRSSSSLRSSPQISLSQTVNAQISEIRSFASSHRPGGGGPDVPPHLCEVQCEQEWNQCYEAIEKRVSDDELWCDIDYVVCVEGCRVHE